MKLRLKILACCLSALALFGAVGCADIGQTFDELKCAHDYGETPTSVIRKASCKEAGAEEWTCKKCQKKKQMSLERLEHTVVIDVEGKEATSISPGTTEGKHCSVCKEVLSTAETLPALTLAMESQPKITFERTEDGTLAVRMRAEMPVEDMDVIRKDIDAQGFIYLAEVNYKKYGAVTEESVYGSNAVYTIGTAAGDHFYDKTVRAIEWSKDEDSDGFSAPWVAGGVQTSPGGDYVYERLTTKYVFTCFLRVGSKRYFAEDVTSSMSFYDGIKKAYADGKGWNYDYPKDTSRKIVFTAAEKEYLYENFIAPVDDA